MQCVKGCSNGIFVSCFMFCLHATPQNVHGDKIVAGSGFRIIGGDASLEECRQHVTCWFLLPQAERS